MGMLSPPVKGAKARPASPPMTAPARPPGLPRTCPAFLSTPSANPPTAPPMAPPAFDPPMAPKIPPTTVPTPGKMAVPMAAPTPAPPNPPAILPTKFPILLKMLISVFLQTNFLSRAIVTRVWSSSRGGFEVYIFLTKKPKKGLDRLKNLSLRVVIARDSAGFDLVDGIWDTRTQRRVRRTAGTPVPGGRGENGLTLAPGTYTRLGPRNNSGDPHGAQPHG